MHAAVMFNQALNSKRLLLILLFIFAFIFRLNAALTVPYTWDEEIKKDTAMGISFKIPDLKIPIGIGTSDEFLPLMCCYLMRIGYDIFGINLLGARILVVVLATAGLYFIYVLAKLGLGKEKAFYSLFLAAFCQFHIGWSRINEEDSLLLFFVPLVLYTSYRAIKYKRRGMLILTGIFLGVGFYAKPTILLLIPVLFLYCAITKGHRLFLKKIENYLIILGIPLIITAPYLYYNLTHNLQDFKFYLKEIHGIGIGLMPIALFLGEAIIYTAFWIDNNTIKRLTSFEYPFMNWVLGLICIAAVIHALKFRKQDFTKFMLSVFFTIFIILSLMNPLGCLHFDEFWWASPMYIPAIILAGNLLVDLKNNYKKLRFFIILFFIYTLFNAWSFINFPENCFVPRKGIIIEHLNERADFYLSRGKKTKAERLQKIIARLNTARCR